MDKRRVVAIVGSKFYNNLPAIKREIAALKPGTKVITGDLGAVNQEVQRLVRERGDLVLEIISSTKYGEDGANQLTMERCEEAIIFCGDSGKAVNLTMLARHLKKPFRTVEDVKTLAS